MAQIETSIVLNQIDALMARANLQPHGEARPDYFASMEMSTRTALMTTWAAGIERLTEPGSQYRETVRAAIEHYGQSNSYALAEIFGALQALRADYEAGYLVGLQELIHADLFADFLEMAGYLIDSGYKDAAAVIAGSVLEEHLRKLALKHGVATENGQGRPRKADSINADLVKVGGYNKLQQKAVTAWLGLRNDAAHGHYDNYEAQQVASLIGDVRDFLLRNPA